MRDVEDLPEIITHIAFDRIKCRVGRKKLERFDVRRIGDAFKRALAL